MSSRTYALTAAALAALVLGCQSGDSNNLEQPLSARSGSSIDTVSAVSAPDGTATATFELHSGTNKLAITAATDAFISTHLVTGDSGIVYVDDNGAEITTNSIFPDSFVSAVNVPHRDFDEGLSGTSITVQNLVGAGSGDSLLALPGHTVSYSVLQKADPDLSSGTLQANIAFVGSTADDPAIRDAIERAIPVFRAIYAQAGITLNVTENVFGGPDILPDPSTGGAIYGSISSALPAPAINICVGQDLTSPDLLGESSGIPGSPLPSVKSCVGVSAINSAGPDGSYGDEDVRVLGETLAHEVGHYLGLFHPVEDGFGQYDDLPDTPECSSGPDCDALLGSNNMYYSPISGADDNLVPQEGLTAQQRAVMNRYAAVD